MTTTTQDSTPTERVKELEKELEDIKKAIDKQKDNLIKGEIARIFGIILASFFSVGCGFIGWLGVSLSFDASLIAIGVGCAITLCCGVYASSSAFIKPNHMGLPILFGKRLRWFEFPEGFNGWLPKPFGEVDIHDMRTREPVNLSFTDDKSIAVADGTKLKSAEISIIWRKLPGRLYDITKIGCTIPKYIEEIAEDRVRIAAIALTASLNKDLKEAQYQNLDVLVLTQSLTRWQGIIKGDDLLEDSEKDTLKESGRILPQTDDGLVNVMKEIGIEIEQVTISSVKLPDNIRKTVDDLILEPVQKKRETQNMTAVIDETKRLSSTDGIDIDDELALLTTMLEKGTKGITINAVRGSKTTSESEKISAALFGQNRISNENGGTE